MSANTSNALDCSRSQNRIDKFYTQFNGDPCDFFKPLDPSVRFAQGWMGS